MRKTGALASGDTEAGGGHPQGADILLRLEKDDVDFRSKEASQHHRTTEAHRDAHGGGLHLQDETKVRHLVKYKWYKYYSRFKKQNYISTVDYQGRWEFM